MAYGVNQVIRFNLSSRPPQRVPTFEAVDETLKHCNHFSTFQTLLWCCKFFMIWRNDVIIFPSVLKLKSEELIRITRKRTEKTWRPYVTATKRSSSFAQPLCPLYESADRSYENIFIQT